jgi:hypothetical protein
MRHKKHEPMQTITESHSTPSVACDVSQEGHTELEKLFEWSKYREAHSILAGRSVGWGTAMLEGHTMILN